MPQEDKSIPEVVNELKELTISYAKQETIDPLRSTGRWVGYGVGGSFLLALGFAMIGLAGLRALQTETGDVLDGTLSWAPYVIVTAVLGVTAVLFAMQIKKDGKGDDR